MTNPVRFAIAGAGWRSEFYLRLAKTLPEYFQVVAVCTHSDASTARIDSNWDVPTVRTLSELVKFAPEFVIAAVSWPAMPHVTIELTKLGLPVLAETPPAPDTAGLRALWEELGPDNNVQVAEQYYLMPGHAARLAITRRGLIGTATAVQIHSTHLYHAVSLIRSYLGVAFDEVTVNARTFEAPLLDPLAFDGWIENPQPESRTTTIATLNFGDGRMGLYDFVQNQWWNPLLSRRIVVRGSLGEITDDSVTRFTDDGPVTSHISYRRTGVDMNLEGNDVVHVSFDGEVIYRNPWVGSRLSEDDIAVASFVQAMGRWVRDDGPPPYPLAFACQDHLIGLAIEKSAHTGQDVRVAKEVWSR